MRRRPGDASDRSRPHRTALGVWLGTWTVAAVFALVLGSCAADEDVAVPPDETVAVFGPWTGTDAERFDEVLDGFREENPDVDVRYEGTRNFTDQLQARVTEADAPDLAVFPDPGLMRDLADSGHVVRLPAEVAEGVPDAFGDAWVDIVSQGDSIYGLPVRASVKSLVWYSPEEFAERGYEVPETWAELNALSGQMRRDGFTPWCMGMEDLDATGWVGTDWIEDLVLRLYGPEVYDGWVEGTVHFTDPRIRTAFWLFERVALDPAMVNGGTRAILTTPYEEAHLPMLLSPPGCFLHRQASFERASIDPSVDVSPDGKLWFFVLPRISDDVGNGIVAGGDVIAPFETREEVTALLEYLADEESLRPWAERGDFTSPHLDLPLEWYPTEFERSVARIGGEAARDGRLRFDASDQMPPEVGSDAFPNAIVWRIGGFESLDDALAEIQARWPMS